jgi:hypothetical protein
VRKLNDNLPEPCEQCAPYGGNWKLTEAGMGRCDCPRGSALRAAEKLRSVPPPEHAEPRIGSAAASQACRTLRSIPFFPAEDEAQTAIADELRSLCGSLEDLDWIVTRMRRLYSRWPGCREMRIVFCTSRRPLSGEDLGHAISEAYPNGVPAQRPAIAAPAPAALPAGSTVSASPSVEAAVGDLTRAKDLRATGPTHRVRDIPLVRVPESRRITQADVDRELQRRRERAATAELCGVGPEAAGAQCLGYRPQGGAA